MTSLRVYYDASTLANATYTGIGVIAVNLAKAFIKRDDLELTIGCKLSRLKRKHFIQNHLGINEIKSFNSITSPSKYDVFYGPDFKIPRTKRIKRVVTIADMVVFEDDITKPDFAEKGRKKFDEMIKKSEPDHITTISHFSKERILNWYPHLENKISVVYLGADHLINEDNVAKVYNFPYILFVGRIEKRKNLLGIVRAFEILSDKYPDFRLVLVGGDGGYQYEKIIDYISSSSYKSKILVEGHVSKSKLTSLFKYASVFTFPSLYEGFGFPVLEAMQFGVPVVTSSHGAMKEISEGAALHADAFNDESIAHEIGRLIDDSSLRNEMIQNGNKHFKSFTWSKCAKETVDVFNLAKG